MDGVYDADGVYVVYDVYYEYDVYDVYGVYDHNSTSSLPSDDVSYMLHSTFSRTPSSPAAAFPLLSFWSNGYIVVPCQELPLAPSSLGKSSSILVLVNVPPPRHWQQ